MEMNEEEDEDEKVKHAFFLTVPRSCLLKKSTVSFVFENK